MKTELTIEESARLIALGVDPKLASKTIVTDEYNEHWDNFQHPVFDLKDILIILPKEIKTDETIMGDNYISELNVRWDCGRRQWDCHYLIIARTRHVGLASELIDSFYQLLIWCINNGYYNTKLIKQ